MGACSMVKKDISLATYYKAGHMKTSVGSSTTIQRAIVVCALGYFIDVFDIQLFTVLRVPSLKELGLSLIHI